MVLWNGVNRMDRIDQSDRIGQAGPATELRLHGQTFYTSVVRAKRTERLRQPNDLSAVCTVPERNQSCAPLHH